MRRVGYNGNASRRFVDYSGKASKRHAEGNGKFEVGNGLAISFLCW